MLDTAEVQARVPVLLKRPATEFSGAFKWFDFEKGYGMIRVEGGDDIFVHDSVLGHYFDYERGLELKDSKVEGEAVDGKRGLVCRRITSIELAIHELRPVAPRPSEKILVVEQRGPERLQVVLFNRNAGYGFFSSPIGDVFFHVTLLRECQTTERPELGAFAMVTYGKDKGVPQRGFRAVHVEFE